MVNDYLTKNHAFSQLVKDMGITEAHMHKVAEALGAFIRIASEDAGTETVYEALGKSGILDLPQPVLMVTFSLIAQGLLGRYWELMRASAKPELIVPQFSKEALIDGADISQRIFAARSTTSRENMKKDLKKWADLPALPPQ